MRIAATEPDQSARLTGIGGDMTHLFERADQRHEWRPARGEMTRGDGRTRVGIANTEATHDDLTLAHGGNGQPATVV